MTNKLLIRLAMFVRLSAFLFARLWRGSSEIPSPLTHSPAPALKLAELHQPAELPSTDDLKRQVGLLNVWVS